MPRKQSRKKKSRKANDENVTESIEAQLKRQRQQAASATTTNLAKDKPRDLSGFVFDTEKNTYFPKDDDNCCNSNSETKTSNDNSNDMISDATTTRFILPTLKKRAILDTRVPITYTAPLRLYAAENISYSTMFQRYYRYNIASRALYESTTLVRDLGEILSRQATMRLSEEIYHSDLYYVHRLDSLSPWIRSFDISPQDQQAVYTCSTEYEDCGSVYELDYILNCPDMINARALPRNNFEDRYDMHVNLKIPLFDTVKADNLYMLKCHTESLRSYVYDLEKSGCDVYETKMFSTDFAVNDFVAHNGKIVLAAEYSTSRQHALPAVMDMDTNPETINCRSFPQSSSLCVKIRADGERLFFGHRNGQVTCLDLRSATSQSTKDYGEYGTQQGSDTKRECVVSINPLEQNENYILAREYNGTVKLYDWRCISSNHDNNHCNNNNNNNNNVERSLVREFSVPKSYSLYRPGVRLCSGVVTDADETTVMTPFVATDPKKSTNVLPYLGMWSLHTGEFIGARRLSSSETKSAAYDRANCRIELCQKRSVGYAWNEATPSPDDDEYTCFGPEKHRWGLWYKLANVSSSTIHHINFDGRYKVDET